MNEQPGQPASQSGSQHEVVDHQLAAAVEQLGQRLFFPRGIEHIVLVQLDPGQGQALGVQGVQRAGVGLFLGQQGAARLEPVFPGNHGLRHHVLRKLSKFDLTFYVDINITSICQSRS
jgi:hypothetical protein